MRKRPHNGVFSFIIYRESSWNSGITSKKASPPHPCFIGGKPSYLRCPYALQPGGEGSPLLIKDPKEAAAIGEIIKKYGLDKPIYVQYWVWFNEVIRGNLGWSHSVAMPVFEAIFFFLPATVELALFATPLIVIGGIILGSLAAARKDRFMDHFTRAMAIAG